MAHSMGPGQLWSFLQRIENDDASSQHLMSYYSWQMNMQRHHYDQSAASLLLLNNDRVRLLRLLGVYNGTMLVTEFKKWWSFLAVAVAKGDFDYFTFLYHIRDYENAWSRDTRDTHVPGMPFADILFTIDPEVLKDAAPEFRNFFENLLTQTSEEEQRLVHFAWLDEGIQRLQSTLPPETPSRRLIRAVRVDELEELVVSRTHGIVFDDLAYALRTSRCAIVPTILKGLAQTADDQQWRQVIRALIDQKSMALVYIALRLRDVSLTEEALGPISFPIEQLLGDRPDVQSIVERHRQASQEAAELRVTDEAQRPVHMTNSTPVLSSYTTASDDGNTNMTRRTSVSSGSGQSWPFRAPHSRARDIFDEEADEDMVGDPTFWEPVPVSFTSADDVMAHYMNFFETFCANAPEATPEALGRFRSVMLASADLLQLSTADRVVLSRRDGAGLCRWMQAKQNETLGALATDSSSDPITLTDCAGIPLLFLVVIDRVCFDIVNLWTYLINSAQKINPATRVPFTAEQSDYVRQRYQATLRIFESLREMV